MRFIANFIKGIKNLWAYSPLIYNDRDWDYVYLLNLMEFKFKRMANRQEKQGNSIEHMRLAKILKTMALLMNRLAEDNYGKKELDEWHIEYCKTPTIWKEYAKFPPGAVVGDKEDTFLYEICHDTTKEEIRLFDKHTKKITELRIQDLEYFAFLFKKHLHELWD